MQLFAAGYLNENFAARYANRRTGYLIGNFRAYLTQDALFPIVQGFKLLLEFFFFL